MALPTMAVLVLGGAVALRVVPFIWGPGAWTVPLDYDDGVYYSAAALVWQGEAPYHDFTFLHPPLVTVVHVPAAVSARSSPETGLLVARATTVVLSAATVGSLGWLLWRRVGRFAAIVGMAVYAVYPWAVVAERRPSLEPIQNRSPSSSSSCGPDPGMPSRPGATRF